MRRLVWLLLVPLVGCDMPATPQPPRINEAAAIVAGVLLLEGEESGADIGEPVEPAPGRTKTFLLPTCFGFLEVPREPNVGDVVLDKKTGRRWLVTSKPPGVWRVEEIMP